MTIKHAIPKIEWAIELLYNSVKTGSQWVEDKMSWRQGVIGKATTQQKGPSGPPIEFGDQTSWWEDAGMRTCSREAGPPGPRLSSPGERERHTAMSRRAGGSICCSLCSVSNSLSHTQPFQIKWEVYFFLKKSSLVFITASKCILHVYMHGYCVTIQQNQEGEILDLGCSIRPHPLYFPRLESNDFCRFRSLQNDLNDKKILRSSEYVCGILLELKTSWILLEINQQAIW